MKIRPKIEPQSWSIFVTKPILFGGPCPKRLFIARWLFRGAQKRSYSFFLVPCCCFLPKMGSQSIALCALWVEAAARSRQDRFHTCFGIHFLSILDNFGCQNLIIWMYFLSNAAVKFSLFWFWSSVRKRVRVQRFHFIQTFPASVVHFSGCLVFLLMVSLLINRFIA